MSKTNINQYVRPWLASLDLRKPQTRRILNHSTASPHALYDVLGLNGSNNNQLWYARLTLNTLLYVNTRATPRILVKINFFVFWPLENCNCSILLTIKYEKFTSPSTDLISSMRTKRWPATMSTPDAGKGMAPQNLHRQSELNASMHETKVSLSLCGCHGVAIPTLILLCFYDWQGSSENTMTSGDKLPWSPWRGLLAMTRHSQNILGSRPRTCSLQWKNKFMVSR